MLKPTKISKLSIPYLIFAWVDPNGSFVVGSGGSGNKHDDKAFADALPGAFRAVVYSRSRLFSRPLFGGYAAIVIPHRLSNQIDTAQKDRNGVSLVMNLKYAHHYWYNDYTGSQSSIDDDEELGANELMMLKQAHQKNSLASACMLAFLCSTPAIDSALTRDVVPGTSRLTPAVAASTTYESLKKKTITDARFLPMIVAYRMGFQVSLSISDLLVSPFDLPQSLTQMGLPVGASQYFNSNRHVAITDFKVEVSAKNNSTNNGIFFISSWLSV